MQSLVGVASAAGRAAVHAVRVQIIPAPRSLVDSREILRILQSYGEVTTYRWLKHDALSSAPNSCMAIFASSDAMNKLLADCPLTFEIDRTVQSDESTFVEASRLDQELEFEPFVDDESSKDDSPQMGSAFETPSSPPSSKKSDYLTRPQLFRINADVWRGKHRDWLERFPFWGPFTTDHKSLIASDLKRKVPLPALSDLDANSKPEIPIRILNQRKDQVAKKMTVREMITQLRGDERSGKRVEAQTPRQLG